MSEKHKFVARWASDPSPYQARGWGRKSILEPDVWVKK